MQITHEMRGSTNIIRFWDENEGVQTWNGKTSVSLTSIGLSLLYRPASNPGSCANHRDP